MLEGKPKVLFTPSYVRLIKLARELNENVKISGDLYFHPSEKKKRIVVKTIDLSLLNPLCEVNSKPGGKQRGGYRIKKAVGLYPGTSSSLVTAWSSWVIQGQSLN